MSRSRRWTITLNNPTIPIEQLYHPSLMSYLVAGSEIAPSTGTPHFQIYLETVKKMSFQPLVDELQTLWNGKPSLRSSKGSADQNRVYCLKENSSAWIEQGNAMKPGQRTDLESVKDAILEGASMADLYGTNFTAMVKYPAGMALAYKILSPHMNSKPKKCFGLDEFPWWAQKVSTIQDSLNQGTVILWGPAGSGKTCFARALLPGALFVTHMDDLTKFNPVTHTGLIFDDMSLLHLHREAQIACVDFDDERSIHVRYTTAFIPAGTKKIFTTNIDQGHIYMAGDAALERRVKKFEMRREVVMEAALDQPVELNWDNGPFAEF